MDIYIYKKIDIKSTQNYSDIIIYILKFNKKYIKYGNNRRKIKY